MAKATGPPNLISGEELLWDADDLGLGVAISITTFTTYLALCGPVIDIKTKEQEDYQRAISWSIGLTSLAALIMSIAFESSLPFVWWLGTAALATSMYEWTRRGVV